jgi:hypothetical protein
MMFKIQDHAWDKHKNMAGLNRVIYVHTVNRKWVRVYFNMCSTTSNILTYREGNTNYKYHRNIHFCVIKLIVITRPFLIYDL